MAIYKISKGFARLPDPDLDAFTEGVLIAMKDNPAFLTPDPTLADVTTTLAAFTARLSAATLGGKADTAAKDEAREVLLEKLYALALYVQRTGNNTLSVLLSSGFEVASNNRAQSPLPQPFIVKITNGESTKLTLQVTPLLNAASYECVNRVGAGPWSRPLIVTQARRIVVPDLIPGTEYTFQVRGVGGSTGFSPWSPTMSHMAT
jgi:hypothetical protein